MERIIKRSGENGLREAPATCGRPKGAKTRPKRGIIIKTEKR